MIKWLKKNWLLVGLGVGAYVMLRRRAQALPAGTPPWEPLPTSPAPVGDLTQIPGGSDDRYSYWPPTGWYH